MYSLTTGRVETNRQCLRTANTRYLCEDFLPLGSSSRKKKKKRNDSHSNKTDRQTSIHYREGALHCDFHETTDRTEGCPPSSSYRLRSHLGASWMGISCCVTSALPERKNYCIHEMLGMLILMHRAQQGDKSTAQSCLGSPLSLFYLWQEVAGL